MATTDNPEDRPLPARTMLGVRQRDELILQDYTAGLSLTQIAEKRGLGNARKAGKALAAALRRLDRKIIENVDMMRAAELVQLNKLSAALEDKMSDPKAAAELRLQSESRRRLHGLDLERKVEGQEIIHFVVDMRPPDMREEGDDAGVIEIGEVEEIPQAALEPGEEEVPDADE